MANQDQITFFDIPSKDGRTWTLNPWKTRFALNYKSLPYHTQWLEYPDIRPTLSPHLPPAAPEPSTSSYTIPAIRFPDGTYMMDSKPIAVALEERYPAPQYPSLHLDTPALAKLESLMPGMMGKLVGVFVPGAVKNILGPKSQPYFKSTREAAFGMSIEELEKTQGGVQAYEKIREELSEVTALLKKGQTSAGGPFFEGDKVSYADFVWAGFLLFMKYADAEGFGKLLEATGDKEANERLLEGVKPWTRDDI